MLFLSAAILGLLATGTANAAVSFVVDPSSYITLAGTINGNTIVAQGPGSLATALSGSIDVVLDDSYSPTSLTVNGSTLSAGVNGQWSPLPGGAAGTATACLGASLTGFPSGDMAIRDLVFAAVTPLAVPVVNGQFASNKLAFTVTNGTADYRVVGGLISGTSPLAQASTNNMAGAGFLTYSNTTATLQIPMLIYINQTISGYDIIMTGSGLIVARAVLPPPPPPVACLSATPTVGVAPVTISFADCSSGNIASRLWVFGDGGTGAGKNPSHTYTNAGMFSVALTVSGLGGMSTTNLSNYITVTSTNLPPDITPPTLVILSPTDYQSFANVPIAVAGTATDASNIQSVTVNGGSATRNGTNWTINVSLSVGTNSLTVIATDASVNHNAATQTIHAVYAPPPPPPPVAKFNANGTSGSVPLVTLFTDRSTGSITTWSWNFGDGGSSNLQSPSHVYSSAGTYSVTLTVAGPGGSDTVSQPNLISVVIPPPDKTPPTILACAPAVTNAAGADCQAALPDLTLSVQATDNATSSQFLNKTQVPTAGTLVGLGTTPVTITVRDLSGNASTCTSSFTVIQSGQPVIVACAAAQTNAASSCQAPVPDFTAGVQAIQNCAANNALFISQSPRAGTLVSTGRTLVTITVSNTLGFASTCTTSFTVTDSTPPTILACAEAVTNAAAANCQAAVPDFTAIMQATDDCTASNALVKTQSPLAGTLVGLGDTPVIITVKDAAGNATTCQSSFVVLDTTPPLIIACAPETSATVSSDGQAVVPDFTAALQATDNCTPTNALVKTQSPPAGTRVGVGATPVTITVLDAAGNSALCVTTFTAIAVPPSAAFTATPNAGIVPLPVAFSNNSTGTIASVVWDFGDGSQSTAANPSHTYTNGASFTVSLTAIGPGGTNTLTRAGYIVAQIMLPPVIIIGPAVTNAFMILADRAIVVAGDTNVFAVTAMDPLGLPLGYQWQFGDGVTNPVSSEPTAWHTYADNCGPYLASVTVSNAYAAVSSNLTVTVACAMTISKPKGKLALRVNFNPKHATADSCRLTATLDLDPTFQPDGHSLTIDVGGAQFSCTLNKNGRGVTKLTPAGLATGRLRYTNPTKTKPGFWKLTATLSKGAWRAQWSAYGLTNETIKSPGLPVAVPIVVLVHDEALAAEPTLHYTATQNRSGKAK